MIDVLFWVIGSCFFLAGLFFLFGALLMFIGWRQDKERVSFKKFLAWAGAGVASEALMLVFYTCKP
ncbi:hypothetical protein FSY75_16965 [Streptomyces sp. TR1341]|uniref:Uncharacterized protein n=1 Tax=Streptomyces murinus TaxID=33900 RepID=A0A7W3NRI4_STRMR|nr:MULTISPECIES: hypothetical protein [Streptomyces]NDK26116.1 hypothetical protein [Streptomyces sp. TR1341]MBA9055354.1 hypothetical protein [Streptomyces murinus]UWW89946.1 hypothetical protein GO605_03120 [Streptomyces murinus]WSI87159.1 hypothetical protein OG516_22755 [Streptomyces murinus]WUD08809.1 hypothetical protein OG586_22505 [Streptomyces murinus]